MKGKPNTRRDRCVEGIRSNTSEQWDAGSPAPSMRAAMPTAAVSISKTSGVHARIAAIDLATRYLARSLNSTSIVFCSCG
jgi:hypothetical protein